GTHRPGDIVRASQPVLYGEHGRRVVQQRARTGGRTAGLGGLCGNDHQVDRLVRNVAVRPQARPPFAAGARYVQTVVLDGLDVCVPAVDDQHVVVATAQQARVDRPHRAASHNRDLHVLPRLVVEAELLQVRLKFGFLFQAETRRVGGADVAFAQAAARRIAAERLEHAGV